MTVSQQSEEVLEALWIQLVEKKQPDADVTLFDRSSAIQHLEEHRLVETSDGRAILTAEGRKEAEGCVRRHRLAERLLTDVLNVKKSLVHETGCEFEHFLRKGVDESICTLLSHPRTCPHGRTIPEGPCCREARKDAGRLLMSLPELIADHPAEIA